MYKHCVDNYEAGVVSEHTHRLYDAPERNHRLNALICMQFEFNVIKCNYVRGFAGFECVCYVVDQQDKKIWEIIRVCGGFRS